MSENNQEIKGRITRETYFQKAALLASERSTCPKKAVGAVLVLDKRIIATSYNGVLPHYDHSKGMDNEGTTHTVHAEANIIAFCAKHGIATKGTTLYLTLSPCEKCAELIIQAGITHVNYIEEYRDTRGIEVLRENDILIGQLKM